MKTTLEIDDELSRPFSHQVPSGAVLGRLKKELKGRSITQVLDELRGPTGRIVSSQ
jgi:hypothetical protein